MKEMEGLEKILIIIGSVVLMAYLAYGIFKMVRMARIVIPAKDRGAITVCVATIIFLLVGIIAILAMMGKMAGNDTLKMLMPLKAYLRPVVSVVVTVLFVCWMSVIIKDTVNDFRTGHTRKILLSILKLIVLLSLCGYMLYHRWEWIFGE